MRAPATRSQRLAFGLAAMTAVALGTVCASAAQATGTSTGVSAARAITLSAGAPEPGEGAGFAVAYKPTSQAPGDIDTANSKFAACMRGHGQDRYPDFHAPKDEGRARLRVELKAGKGFDPASHAYRDALDTCAPILEKTGVTFPEVPDLPPVPEHPGKDGGPSLVARPATV
ncbi:hypothetical protein [Streptomyces herbicida]|uniref:hypothetical protein n=1 Tax=Streptomyces herbicida TaxID=3065675 RepID=UPI00292E0CDD|nr:hypothetical protein [Streptomyces sp. NEAU-HV9]